MLFEISNLRDKRTSHCGVMEFVAEEGVVYLPYWVREDNPIPKLDGLTLISTAVDDAKSVTARGRYREAKEHLAAQRHVCQAEAAIQGLPGHHQPQGCVRAWPLTS